MIKIKTYNLFENNSLIELQDKILNSVKGYNDYDIKDLLTPGVNLNFNDNAGWSPLLAAITRNDDDTVKLLIQHGADVNYQTRYKTTAIITAAYCGYNNMIELLLKEGADIDHININGATALINASTAGRLQSVKLLLEKGANPLVINTDGDSFLYSGYEVVRQEYFKPEFQIKMIKKYPTLYTEFKRYGYLHDSVKKLFPALDTANDLNLL